MRLRLLLTLLLIGATTGCSQLLLRQTCVGLSRDVNYCLAPLPVPAKELREKQDSPKPQRAATTPDSPTPQSRSQTQKVSIEVDGKRHELLSELELSPQQLSVVGVASLGQPLFEVVYDGKQLISEQSLLLGDNFRAEYLLALLQLIYWPEHEINAALSGGEIQEQGCKQARCRVLFSADEGELIHIGYSHRDPWQAQIVLQIPAANLMLKITPLA